MNYKILYERVLNHLNICNRYRYDFEAMHNSLEFQIRHFRFYFVNGYPYFYQLGSPRSYSINYNV